MFQTSSPYIQSLYSNDSIRFQIKSHHYLQEISSKASTKVLLHISMHNNVSGNNKSFFYFIILYFVIYFKSFWQHIEKSPKQMFQTSPLLDDFLYLHSAFQNDDNRIVFHNADVFHKPTNRDVVILREIEAVGRQALFDTLNLRGHPLV